MIVEVEFVPSHRITNTFETRLSLPMILPFFIVQQNPTVLAKGPEVIYLNAGSVVFDQVWRYCWTGGDVQLHFDRVVTEGANNGAILLLLKLL